MPYARHDNTANEEDEKVEISLHALSGVITSLTMQLRAVIADKSVRALVDSGSTHCFIVEDTAPRPRTDPTPGTDGRCCQWRTRRMHRLLPHRPRRHYG